MREHLRIRDLADLRDGRLEPSARSAAERHLASGCAECAAAAARVDGLLSVMRQGLLPLPPRAAVRDAVKLFRARKWANLLALPGRIVAKLVLDQRMELVPALRSSPGSTRRTLWNVGRFELDACLVERAGDADLLGQVLPSDDEGAAGLTGEVVAHRDGRTVARAALDPDGRFEFLSIPHGTYALTGRVDGDEFLLSPLGVGGDA